MAREVCRAGVDLVKQMEGFREEAYRCPAGIWTIGYGHTRGVAEGDRISREFGEVLLRRDLAAASTDVERLVRVALNDHQHAALASFVFNVGGANFARSTLLKRLNAGHFDDVPVELARWVKVKDPETGKRRTMAGLVKRRSAEAALWMEPVRQAESGKGVSAKVTAGLPAITPRRIAG